MSGSRWLHQLALGGFLAAILLAAPALGQEEIQEPLTTPDEGQRTTVETPSPEKEGSPSAQGQEAPTDNALPPAPTLESQETAEPPCGPRCQAAEQREKDDLVAQESMANSTSEIVNLSIGQLVVSAIGILALIYTLYLTRKSTRAAIDANNIAREVARQECRAYLFVDRAERWQRDVGDPWFAKVVFKNCGQTPALNVKVRIAHRLFGIAEYPNAVFVEPPPGPVFSIGPGQSNTTQKELPELTGAAWEQFKLRQKILVVWGRVDYSDVFGDARWLTFRLAQDGSYILNFQTDHGGNETSESVATEPPAAKPFWQRWLPFLRN